MNAVPSVGAVYQHPICPFATDDDRFSALNSPLYLQYCQLYDEVKCIGTKASISIGTPIGTATVPSLTIVTAWDRRLSTHDIGNEPGFAQLKNYGSQQTAVAVNNSIAKLVRSCYASDLLEKAQWHDCTVQVAQGDAVDMAWAAAGENPNFFCPGMWLGVAQGNTQAAQTITFQVEINYYFAFRNPKYGASASDSKIIQAPIRQTLDNEVIAQNMDEEDGGMDEDAEAAIMDIQDLLQPQRGDPVAEMRRRIARERLEREQKRKNPVTKTIE